MLFDTEGSVCNVSHATMYAIEGLPLSFRAAVFCLLFCLTYSSSFRVTKLVYPLCVLHSESLDTRKGKRAKNRKNLFTARPFNKSWMFVGAIQTRDELNRAFWTDDLLPIAGTRATKYASTNIYTSSVLLPCTA